MKKEDRTSEQPQIKLVLMIYMSTMHIHLDPGCWMQFAELFTLKPLFEVKATPNPFQVFEIIVFFLI